LLPMASQVLPRTLVNMRLDLKSIAAAALPRGKADHIIWDDELPGFGLRLRAGGHRSWVVQYRSGDRQTRRATSAAVAKLAPADARQEARKLLSKVALGQDPQEEKASKRRQASPSVTLLMAGLSKPRHKRKREPNREILERLFPPDGMPSPEVRPAHIKRAYREECNRIGLPESDRYSETQLLRVTGRNKS